MDEGFELLTLVQTGKSQILPIIMVDVPGGDYWSNFQKFIVGNLLNRGLIGKSDLSLYKITHSIEEAVEEIGRFYTVFHSYRYVQDKLVIRTKGPLAENDLQRLNQDFADMFKRDNLKQTSALPEETDEPLLAHLSRLVCHPHRTDFGRIRELINAINLCPI
jgi:hypothetical protein